MEKKKVKLEALIIIVVWLIGLIPGFKIFENTKKENYYIYKDETVENYTESEIFLLKNTTLKPGEYTVSFEYSAQNDMKIQVVSVAEYELENDSFKIYRETVAPAGENRRFDYTFSLDKETMMTSVIAYFESGKIPVVNNLIISNTNACYTDSTIYSISYILIFSAVMSFVYYIVVHSQKEKKLHILIVFLSVVLICVLSNSIYLTKATPAGHDIAFHMRRIEGLAKNIHDGNYFQRINTVFNAGYGYINPVMYPELFLYLPAFLVYIGMSTLGAMKMFYIAVNAGTVLCSFYAFKKLSKNDIIGVCLSAVYTLSFYRMENVYIRGAMGESLFMVFLPLTVYALYTIMYEDRKRWLMFALSVSAIIQSHILGSLFTVLILGCEFIAFATDLIIRKKFTVSVIVECIKSVVFTVLLNFWFIVPFMWYYFTRKFLMFDKTVQMERFFQQIIPLKSMLSLTVVKTNIVENMGILVMVAVVTAFMGCLYIIKRDREKAAVVILMVIAVVFGLACTDVFPWKLLSSVSIVSAFMNTIQFSFRFYGIFICAVCQVVALSAKGLFEDKGRGKYVVLAALLVVSCVSTYDFYDNSGVNRRNARYNSYYYDAPNEYLMSDAVFANEIGNPQKVKSTDNIKIKDYSKDGDRVMIEIEKTGTEQGTVKLPLFYYYSYGAETQDGERVNLVSGENGCLTCVIDNPGEYVINVAFKNDRKIFMYPLAVSVSFVIGFALYMCYNAYKKQNKSMG